uniref:Uncharacterized protein n=2 Tax=Caenorhabditis japonica TaxID=281687 RepID=A0A8R1HMH5_CAEJA
MKERRRNSFSTEMKFLKYRKAAYVPLIPKKPSTCHSFLFVLLAQQASLQTLDTYCDGMCEARRKFRLELFKQQHGLRLSALSTVSSCYDLPYAHHVLQRHAAATQNVTMERRGGKHRASLHTPMSSEVCAAFHVSPHHKCPVSGSASLFGLLIVAQQIFYFIFL